MSDMKDFVIENGELKKYVGPGGDVVIPDGVISIGRYAFFRCSSPTNVTIPNSVASIGVCAFDGCNCLTDITIPDSVTSIGAKAFSYCESLISVTISAGVTSIGAEAFSYCKSLTSVTIPNSVKSIGDGAFEYCKSLLNVTIPDSVTEIGAGAFPWFVNVVLPDGLVLNHFRITENGTLQKYTGPDDHVVIPDGVIKIERYAFSEPHISYNLPKRNLYWVTLSKSVKKVEKGSFLNSSVCGFMVEESSKALKAENGVLLSKDGKKLILYPPKGDSDVCIIPDSVESISGGAFCGINGDWSTSPPTVKWITIPKTVEKMAKNAFTFVPEFGGLAYEFIYNAAFISLVPNPVYLGDLNDAAPKEKNKLVEGFLQAVRHGRPEVEPYKDSYIEHIRNNVKSYIKWTYDCECVFRLFIQEKLIPKQWVSKVMAALEEENRTDLKAELLVYQQANFGVKGKDPFSLSDNDPDLKRRLQMAQRREAIKDQTGIKGLAFVATGYLKHFGDYDEYTGAIDRSDLKEFIEARGGFLRSAVSSKTDYLICNDQTVDSVKLKKALELGVTIIDEKTFLKMAKETEK